VFIEAIRNKYPFDDILLMMDNLSLHKGPDLRKLYDELGFLYTFTPVYSPQYNGIEEVINIGKKRVKDRRLELILQNKREDLTKIILDSFNNIEP
jgi:transposase